MGMGASVDVQLDKLLSPAGFGFWCLSIDALGIESTSTSCTSFAEQAESADVAAATPKVIRPVAAKVAFI